MNWILLSPPPLSSDPDNPPKFGTCTNGKIDEEEFNLLQTFHFKTINELTGVDRKMEAENRNQFEKNLIEEINEIKKTLGTRV